MDLTRTLLIIKPGYILRRKFVGEIISFLERNNLDITELRKTQLSFEQAKDFYRDHQNKPFFDSLIKFMCSSPIVVMCLTSKKKKSVVEFVRKIVGATDPRKAKLGTIRRMYGENIEANGIHSSDSALSAQREIDFFFG